MGKEQIFSESAAATRDQHLGRDATQFGPSWAVSVRKGERNQGRPAFPNGMAETLRDLITEGRGPQPGEGEAAGRDHHRGTKKGMFGSLNLESSVFSKMGDAALQKNVHLGLRAFL